MGLPFFQISVTHLGIRGARHKPSHASIHRWRGRFPSQPRRHATYGGRPRRVFCVVSRYHVATNPVMATCGGPDVRHVRSVQYFRNEISTRPRHVPRHARRAERGPTPVPTEPYAAEHESEVSVPRRASLKRKLHIGREKRRLEELSELKSLEVSWGTRRGQDAHSPLARVGIRLDATGQQRVRGRKQKERTRRRRRRRGRWVSPFGRGAWGAGGPTSG